MALNNIIDISHHQSRVDFNKVKAAGIDGVIHKATQGLRMKDRRYAEREGLARSAGLLWGAYHFGVDADGAKQAEHFLKTAGVHPETLLALDFEPNPTGGTMTLSQARDFVQYVYAMRYNWPVLYTGAAIVRQTLNDPVLANCPLWWAQYGPRPTRIPTKTWQTWTFWQYTDGTFGPEPHHVDGVGFCDRDQFNGTLSGLRRLWGAE